MSTEPTTKVEKVEEEKQPFSVMQLVAVIVGIILVGTSFVEIEMQRNADEGVTEKSDELTALNDLRARLENMETQFTDAYFNAYAMDQLMATQVLENYSRNLANIQVQNAFYPYVTLGKNFQGLFFEFNDQYGKGSGGNTEPMYNIKPEYEWLFKSQNISYSVWLYNDTSAEYYESTYYYLAAVLTLSFYDVANTSNAYDFTDWSVGFVSNWSFMYNETYWLSQGTMFSTPMSIYVDYNLFDIKVQSVTDDLAKLVNKSNSLSIAINANTIAVLLLGFILDMEKTWKFFRYLFLAIAGFLTFITIGYAGWIPMAFNLPF